MTNVETPSKPSHPHEMKALKQAILDTSPDHTSTKGMSPNARWNPAQHPALPTTPTINTQLTFSACMWNRTSPELAPSPDLHSANIAKEHPHRISHSPQDHFHPCHPLSPTHKNQSRPQPCLPPSADPILSLAHFHISTLLLPTRHQSPVFNCV